MQPSHRKMERLLAQMLTRHGGMRRLIRKADPGETRPESEGKLRRLALIVQVGLHRAACVRTEASRDIFDGALIMHNIWLGERGAGRSVVFRINAGKEVQIAGCRRQRPASPAQRLIDLSDAVAHPGVLRA
jgi:hypothetical protein